jgi:hypothetical protein
MKGHKDFIFGTQESFVQTLRNIFFEALSFLIKVEFSAIKTFVHK